MSIVDVGNEGFLLDQIDALEAEVERLREAVRELLAGSAKDDPYVKAALDKLLTPLAGEGDEDE